ncbi:MAG: general secretion pathway protein K [Verrucomicrobiales bacterium]|jgi:general secretion pathway protein K
MKLSRQQLAAAKTRGSALMMVFWLMAILTLFLFTSIQLVSSDVALVISQKHDFRAEQLCEMGIAIAANREIQRYDPLLQRFDPVAQEGYSVRIRGEGGKLNINVLLQQQDTEFIDRIFTFWGMELVEAQELRDALLDWVDPDDETKLNGAENEYYSELGFFTYPFNRPFYDIEEMSLVKGIDSLNFVKPGWRSFFTLFSGGKLDLVEADMESIMMVAEVSNVAAEDFVVQRAGADGIEGTEDDTPFASLQEALSELGISAEDPQANRLTVNDQTVRIESTGTVGDYRKQIVLVLRNRESNPVILNREEIFQ